MGIVSLTAIANKYKIPFLIALVIVAIFMTGGCNRKTENQVTNPSISAGVEYWQNQFPDYQLVKWAEDDLNADDLIDTVVIYRQADAKCRMLIVMNLPDGYHLTDTIAAPVNKQEISFSDFDNKQPMEVVVSGKSGRYIGIGIFRLEEGQIINVFAEGYDKCCQ